VAGAKLCRVRGTASLRLERSGRQGHEWYDVRVTVRAHEDNPQWQGWCVESDGQTPWEGAQVAAFEVLSEICQEFGDKLVNGPVGSFPRVDVSQTTWNQPSGNALVRDRDERDRSSLAEVVTN